MFDADIFYAKIVDTENEGDRAPVVFPETGCDGTLSVAFDGQPFLK